MCRYRYGDKKCAHPKNMAVTCVGEENCTYMDDKLEDLEAPDKLQGPSHPGGIEENSDEDESSCEYECPMTECGVYCKKYNRFYCAGKESCQTEDEYLEHMNEYGGVDIDRNPDDGPDGMK